ncbi:guanylate kinase [Conchiformibius kuhniae]|uniref:Guanylate kinase n=1 Tax=Conchiformibius kuhniae TaxID=211502 RepID=A0A8T9MXN0_9NEIS|nr:guanylate kinase [Conchiformibius kuhniae]UOP04962.1 guanylate kinase [Conchiformibius kuhniae]
MTHPKKGNVFIISAASGTGKTTLVSRLCANPDNRIRVSVSHTTRDPRAGESDGTHYHFVSKQQFMELVGQGAFLEHAEVFGHYYGTGMAGVEDLCNQGFDVILEIDIQGAEQVRRLLPDAVSIFLLPPSLAVLGERLRGRDSDSPEVIARRLLQAEQEIQQAFIFDFVVENHDLDTAEADLLHIFKAHRFSQKQQRTTIEKILQNH